MFVKIYFTFMAKINHLLHETIEIQAYWDLVVFSYIVIKLSSFFSPLSQYILGRSPYSAFSCQAVI